ncbi:hypothetical protein EYF80_048238 [Liparis tanakae]|uniref:Uncharacterized protein n=1 Tax=Liparis tanakae TaxID=230148 RepID=A0A4Z2FL06_9TELE|nr:hypothetical protein EYF80_048238 [Liparis tanakae]
MNKSPEFDMLKEPPEPGRREGAVASQRDREQAASSKAAAWRGAMQSSSSLSEYLGLPPEVSLAIL